MGEGHNDVTTTPARKNKMRSQQPHRLLFVSTMQGSPWGGSEELWSSAALRLRQHGCDVWASVPYWPSGRESWKLKELENAGVYILRREKPGFGERFLRRLSGRAGQKHYEVVDKLRPDLVVLSCGAVYEGLDWLDACLQRQQPCVLVAHSTPPHFWLPDEEALRASRLFEAAARTYFVCQWSLDTVRKQLGTALDNARIVRNPYNVAWDVDLPWPADSDEYRLAYVGRLDIGGKGLDLLADVLSRQEWRARPLIVSVFGEGPTSGTLKRLIASSGAKMNICGATQDIQAIWSSHHALILPSRGEALPIVLVEAMLCARPAIVTDVGGVRELVTHSVNGFIAAAPTALHLHEALSEAWASRSNWQEMGQRARETIRQWTSADPTGDFVAELLELLS